MIYESIDVCAFKHVCKRRPLSWGSSSCEKWRWEDSRRKNVGRRRDLGEEKRERVEDKLAADKASEKRGVRPRNTADDCEHPIRHVVYVSA